MTTPLPFSQEWLSIVVGGVEFDGGAKITGTLLKKKLDRRRAPGADGARIIDRGFDLAEGTLTLRGWTEAHMAALDRIQALAFPRGSTVERRNALDVSYPTLARVGITQLYFVESDAIETEDDGAFSQSFKIVEYRPPPASQPSTTRAPAPANNEGGGTALDDVFHANPIPNPATANTGP